MTSQESRPGLSAKRTEAADKAPGSDQISREILAEQLRRRRAASWRLPPLGCGHRDPIDGRAGS